MTSSNDFKPIDQVMREMDQAPIVEREEIVRRVRECVSTGGILSSEDERLLAGYLEGSVSSEELAQNFAERM
jgi:hypothetical protein